MLLIFLIVVLLFAVTFFQAMHGLFSALIMAVLTVSCAALAFASLDYVAVHWTMKWRPDYAYSLALAGTFAVPLAVLRAVFDQLIRRSSLLPAMVDRVGGGIFGLVSGFVIVGVFALCIQMLPFEYGEFLTYSRIDFQSPERSEDAVDDPIPQDPMKSNEIFLNPDRAAVAIATYVADNLYSVPDRSLRAAHPDLVDEFAWTNSVPMEMQRYAPPGAIEVLGTRKVDWVYEYAKGGRQLTDSKPIPPDSGNEFWAVKVRLGPDANSKRSGFAFTLRQFILTGRRSGRSKEELYFPIAIETPDNPDRLIKLIIYRTGNWPVVDLPYAPKSADDKEVEMVFEVPQGFEAEYLTFKIGARAELAFDADRDGMGGISTQSQNASAGSGSTGAGASDPSGGNTTASSGGRSSGDGTVPPRARGGNIRGVSTRVGASHFGERFPVTLRSYRRYKNAEINRGKLSSGGLIGKVGDQAGGSDTPVSAFDVPSDKRLLQLNVVNLEAKSVLGKAMYFAVRTVQNYKVIDENGKPYQLVGKYAVANVGGEEIVEVQYFKEQVGSIGGVGAFEKITHRDMGPNSPLVLLFLVDPGVRIVEFTSGGAANRADDLRGENLVAPG